MKIGQGSIVGKGIPRVLGGSSVIAEACNVSLQSSLEVTDCNLRVFLRQSTPERIFSAVEQAHNRLGSEMKRITVFVSVVTVQARVGELFDDFRVLVIFWKDRLQVGLLHQTREPRDWSRMHVILS